MTKVVVSPKNALRVYRCSYLFILNIIYTYSYSLYLPLLLYIGGLATSLNYWRNPRYDYNRLVDMTWIISCCIYQYGYCNYIQYNYYYLYNLFMITTVILYLLGVYNKSNEYISTNYHISCHITGHIAYYFLYTGLIVYPYKLQGLNDFL